MAYELREPEQPWSWRRMLNGMSDATLERVVGPGIVGIRCQPIHGSYDHSRRHVAKELRYPDYGSVPVPIWDVVVTRSDGTAVRFHPSQTSRKISIMDFAELFETEGPENGKGQSDGPGTYRRMLQGSYHERGGSSKGKG